MAFDKLDPPPKVREPTIAEYIRRGYEINVYCGNFSCIRNKPTRKGGKPNGSTLNLSCFDPDDGLDRIKKLLKCVDCGKREATYRIGSMNDTTDRPENYNVPGGPRILPHGAGRKEPTNDR